MGDEREDRAPAGAGTTRDGFFGGRLTLAQPSRGHRSGTDAVLLAAAVPRDIAGLCLDVGAGVGAVGLGIAVLCPLARVLLVERDAATAELARANAASLPREEPVAVIECDMLDKAARRRLLPERAVLVATNPPFHDPARSRASPTPSRRAAHVMDEGVTLEDWLLACLDCLNDRGVLVAIHAAAALPSILRVLADRAGAVVAKPVQPRAGAPAHRVLVRAVKGSRAPFTLGAPLALHDDAGRLTAEADRLHRGEAALVW